MNDLEHTLIELVKTYSVRTILETLAAVLDWKEKGVL